MTRELVLGRSVAVARGEQDPVLKRGAGPDPIGLPQAGLSRRLPLLPRCGTGPARLPQLRGEHCGHEWALVKEMASPESSRPRRPAHPSKVAAPHGLADDGVGTSPSLHRAAGAPHGLS